MTELLNNENFMWGAMAIIVLCLSQLLKLPIKALTKKFIKSESTRTRVNTTLMLIPLCLGIILDWLFCTLYLNVPFDAVNGVKIGATAVTLYGLLEKLIKGAQSKETTATLELTEEIIKDGKVDENDNSMVSDYLNKLNKV